MDEFVFKPRKSCRVKGPHDPVDYARDSGVTVATRMIYQRNIQRAAPNSRFLPSGTPRRGPVSAAGSWRFILTRWGMPGDRRSEIRRLKTYFPKCDPVHICKMKPTRRVWPNRSLLRPVRNWRRDCSDMTGLAGGTTLVANSDNRLRLVSDSDAHLRSIIATLEQSRAALIESANAEAAQILSVAILQLRMRLHRIADAELKDLCQAVLVQEAERSKKSEDPVSKDLVSKDLVSKDPAAKDRHFTGRGSRWPNSIK
jgi:hypothetical protein